MVNLRSGGFATQLVQDDDLQVNLGEGVNDGHERKDYLKCDEQCIGPTDSAERASAIARSR